MRNAIIAVVAVVVIGGGAGAYLLTRDTETDSAKTDSAQTTEDKQDSGNQTATFSPKLTTGQSFIATLTGSASGESALSGTIESDGKGNAFFKGSQGGETVEYYILSDGSFVFCQNSTCFKGGSNSVGLSKDDYEFNESDVEEFRNKATYVGKESCASGTCDVWHATEEGSDVKIFIDAQTNLVTQVEGSDSGDTFKIVYEYKDVTINVPTNVQTLPGITQ